MNRFHYVCAAVTLLAGAACDRSVSHAPPETTASVPMVASGPSAPSASATASAPSPSASAPTAGGAKVTFDREEVGAPSTAFEAVVGDWYVAEGPSGRGFKVDGGRWRNGTPSVNLADQAKRLYGDRYAEFLDGVKAFAFFPLAVWKEEPPPGDVRLSVRFYPEAGKVDQAAGIAFAIAPDGSYLGVRANALEDNLLFFRVVKGKRTILDTVRGVATSTKAWHTLSVTLRGKGVVVDLDGARRFETSLDGVPVGRVGLWSKADSQVVFDDFEVAPLGRTTGAP